ncbi:TetR/AcrR family transcriptional regulator [Nocardia sp. BMG51109]|uniref:TetR/AcrR family transcriptional regulator n=1 Tax=Nocardia sp. BMG51109 TaxID=1056816 RepID=UPI000465E300|nr:TetR/AcrR family transcriptional regulator [Nocardia sp. BMG51109]
MSEVQDKPGGREAQRLRTRQRVLDAAIAEFMNVGMADADIGTIAEAAGVARGTFYFHFPSKEHALLELETREEARIAKELSRFLDKPHDLPSALRKTIRLVANLEGRLGNLLFKEMLAIHFSPARPLDDEWREHPVIVLVVDEIRRARENGEAEIAVDPYHSAVFFLIGLYALLTTTSGSKALRDSVLDNYLVTILRSLEPR